jgi:divalent metal cation (Fe/Co/Zn/Cd) transporter
LLADSIHSLSDVVSDGVTIVAARYSSSPADARFPYGYGKWEGLATMWISVCLIGGASGMMWHFGRVGTLHVILQSKHRLTTPCSGPCNQSDTRE